MRFTELICHVAASKFSERAQLGVRLSPVTLDTDEAGELARVARELLPAGTFIAVAAPGAPAYDDDRTCTSDGERAAERATAWRNQLGPGERILYVSVRRLGRAGGLEDTLSELTEADLREGLLAWCEQDGRLPKELVGALRSAGVVDRADARSLCRFATAAVGEKLEKVGELLPLIDLAADSRLAEAPKERIAANARWVKSAATGDNRGTGRMGPRAVDLRKQLGAAITSDDGASASRLGGVDLGDLSTDELNSDAPKATRAPRPNKEPAPKAAADSKGKTSATPKPAPKTSKGASGARTATPPEQRDQQPKEEERGGRPDGGVGEPSEPVSEADDTSDGGPLTDPELARSADLDAPVSPEESADEQASGETHDAEESGTPDMPPAPRPRPRPAPRARARPLSGPWTEVMHGEERGGAGPLPLGLARLLTAVLEGNGDGLVWTVSNDPAGALTSPPKEFREPGRQDTATLDAAHLTTWRDARHRVASALGDAALDVLWRTPYTALGDERVAPLVVDLLHALIRLLESADAAGPEALIAALALDTASLVTPFGHAIVVLSPLHPLVLAPMVDRLPRMAQAAQLKGASRSVLAAEVDGPLPLPTLLPTPWGNLPWCPSGLTTPIFGAATVDDPAMADAVEQVVLALARLHPQAGLALSVAAEAAPGAVARGVAQALTQEPSILRAVVHCREAISLGDAGDPLWQTGRLGLEPLDAETRPHIWVRAPASLSTCAAAPIGLPKLGLDWRLAERGPVDLSAVVSPRDSVAWSLVVGARLKGTPRRPQFVLSRGSAGQSRFAVLSADPRGAARALIPTYKAVGVEKLTPKTVEHLTRDLSVGAAGLVSLDKDADGRIAALLVELAVAQLLGEDAMVAGLEAAHLRVLLGLRGGSFCMGAAWTPVGVRIVFGVGLISRAPGAAEAEALERGLEVVRLAGRDSELGLAARRALVAALQSGWRRHEDGPAIVEAILDRAALSPEVLAVGAAGSAGLQVGGKELRVRVVTPGMLEELVVGMRS